jgi:4-hydroxybenzoyl-CoA thioesterase
VHFTVDFIKPTRYGERLTFNLWTVKAGTTSCELRIEASHQGEIRMRAKQVLVFISAASARATPIPPELISRMQRFAFDAESAPPPKKRVSRR